MKTYRLLDARGEPYATTAPGAFGGNRKLRIYGHLGCPSATRYLDRGYPAIRVFFANEGDAVAAGFRPCGICMRDEYKRWKAGQEPAGSGNGEAALLPPVDALGDELGLTVDSASYRASLASGSVFSVQQRKLLAGWLGKDDGWATPLELAALMGYEGMGRINIDVGQVGKLIIDLLGLDEADYRKSDGGGTRYWAAYCDLYRAGCGWHLDEAFCEVLREVLR